MSTLIEVLKANRIDTVLPELKLDFDRMFGGSVQVDPNPYRDHEWVVRNVPVFGYVVNAVPRPERIQDLFWEEWFRKDGKTFHHILFLKKPERWDEIFVAPERDDIHPPATLGRTWYVVDDPDMSPVLLR